MLFNLLHLSWGLFGGDYGEQEMLYVQFFVSVDRATFVYFGRGILNQK